MSTPVAGALAVTPLYATPADALVSWDDAGATWRSLGTIPVGGGTVTSISAGTGITVSPSPIVGAGTVSLTVPVSVANGGTGTSTVMTAGSVTFAGSSGVRAQDNTNLFWDDGNNRLGIGTNSPSGAIEVNYALQDPTALANGISGGVIFGQFGSAGMQLGTRGTPFASYIQARNAAGAGVAYNLLLNPLGGNVGIGTLAPGRMLEIGDGATVSPAIGLNCASGTAAGSFIRFAHGGTQHSVIGDYSAVNGGAYNQALTFYTSGSNIIFQTAGNVGIGTASPATAFHVAKPSVAYNDNVGTVVISDFNIVAKKLYLGYDAALGTNGSGFIQSIYSGVALTSLLLNPNGGNVGIGTTSPGSLLTANGVCANVSGAWTTISAREMKDAESVQPYTRGLEALVQLRPVAFRYTSESPFARPADDPGDPLIGLIADEVAPHVPEIVGEMTATVGKDAREIAISTLEPGLLIFSVINALREVAARLAVLEVKL